MSRLIRRLIFLAILVVWVLYRGTWHREFVEPRKNPHWQVIEADLRHADSEALIWADETIRETLEVPNAARAKEEFVP